MTATAAEIRREIAELDRLFDSPANVKSGALKVHAYEERRRALRGRLEDAERVERAEAASPRAAPARPRYVMPADDRARWAKLEATLDYARDHGAVLTFRDAISDPSYIDLQARRALEAFDAIDTKLDDFGRLRAKLAYLEADSRRIHRLLELYVVEAPKATEFEATLNGRMLTLSFGATTRTAQLDIPLWRGPHRSGEAYTKSDMVVSGGSHWIALRDTSDRPPSDDWQQCVRGIKS